MTLFPFHFPFSTDRAEVLFDLDTPVAFVTITLYPPIPRLIPRFSSRRTDILDQI